MTRAYLNRRVGAEENRRDYAEEFREEIRANIYQHFARMFERVFERVCDGLELTAEQRKQARAYLVAELDALPADERPAAETGGADRATPVR